MPGVQTLLPLLLDHMNAGRLTLERLIDLTSAGPARIYGIAGKGRIAVGYDADLTLVDLKARRTIRESWIASRCGWTPFDGMAVTGWPMATIVRGQVVMREDQLIGTPPAASCASSTRCELWTVSECRKWKSTSLKNMAYFSMHGVVLQIR